jgi:hypothetical protein
MFEIVRKAGLTATDLARLLNVNRCTCSLWMNNHRKPHHLHAQSVEAELAAIKAAVRSKALPTALPRQPEQRHRALTRIIRQHAVH